jgi:hypothetical protein
MVENLLKFYLKPESPDIYNGNVTSLLYSHRWNLRATVQIGGIFLKGRHEDLQSASHT